MNKDELQSILPHREPMLLIDEAFLDEDGSAVGIYTVRGDEFFLQGHFPGNPVVPGVILCEMMAQCCAVLLTKSAGGTYYTGLDSVRFRGRVVPGDTLRFVCRINRSKGPFHFAEGKGHVGGRLCVEGRFSFAVGV